MILTVEPTAQGKRAGYPSVDEAAFQDGRWLPGGRLNGARAATRASPATSTLSGT